jgi:hypothetical protein
MMMMLLMMIGCISIDGGSVGLVSLGWQCDWRGGLTGFDDPIGATARSAELSLAVVHK